MLMMRRRWLPIGLGTLVVPLGLWLRFSAPVPEWLRDGSGGVLYVLFWMLAFLVVNPDTPSSRLAVTVFIATCGVEFSQAVHVEWLERLRATLVGRLILGTTFRWGDFPPYGMGAMLGWLLVRVREKGRVTQKGV